MSREYNVQMLIMALHSYYDQNASYFPVDTDTMNEAIEAVIEAQSKALLNKEERLMQIFSHRDGTEPSVRRLINLATALSDFDANVHDQLLYVEGKILRS